DDGIRRRAVRVPEFPGLGGSGFGAVFRRVARDRRDRRDAQHAGACLGRAVLHAVPRIVLDLDLGLAAVVWPGLCRLRAVLAEWTGRHLGAPEQTVVAGPGGSRRHAPASDLRRAT